MESSLKASILCFLFLQLFNCSSANPMLVENPASLTLSADEVAVHKAEKPSGGVKCAQKYAHLCGACLPSKHYLSCQAKLFGRSNTPWALPQRDPLSLATQAGVPPSRLALCTGFISLLSQGDGLCTLHVTVKRLRNEAFAREAAIEFVPHGGSFTVRGNSIEWVLPKNPAVRSAAVSPAVKTDENSNIAFSDRQGGTPSRREKNTNGLTLNSISQRYLDMVRRRFYRLCPPSTVRTKRTRGGWKTDVNC